LILGLLFALGAGTVHADFIISLPSESDITNEQKLFLDNAVHNSMFIGVVGDQSVGPIIDITPNLFPTNVGNGWSTISGVQDGLTSITFTPQDSNLFTSFSTRGSLFADGDVTITVTDNFSQSFSFTEKKSQDWDRIGVAAVFGSGEFISSVVVSASAGNIKELKQIAFGDLTGNPTVVSPVPEPSTLVMSCLGIASMGIYSRYRRRRLSQ